MKIFGMENNDYILLELGSRIKQTRVIMSYTQAELAQKAGISHKTLERIESGENVRLDVLISILRAMDLLQNIDLLIPEQVLKPTELHDRGRKRVRATSTQTVSDNTLWKWGDES